MMCLDKQSYSKFLELHISSDFILECIQSDEKVHPCVDELCMVLIHTIKSKTTYVININHPDCTVFIDKEAIPPKNVLYSKYSFCFLFFHDPK